MGEISSTTTASAQIFGKNLQVSQLKRNIFLEGNVSCAAQPEPVAFRDQTKTAAEDACQQGSSCYWLRVDWRTIASLVTTDMCFNDIRLKKCSSRTVLTYINNFTILVSISHIWCNTPTFYY